MVSAMVASVAAAISVAIVQFAARSVKSDSTGQTGHKRDLGSTVASAWNLPVAGRRLGRTNDGRTSIAHQGATDDTEPGHQQPIRIMVCGGDSMLGRAVNLTLPWQSPGDAQVADSCPAVFYLRMALHQSRGGSDLFTDSFDKHLLDELQQIRHANEDGARVWGDLLQLSCDVPPDLRLLNLETALTETIDNSDVPRKGINYHMHTANLSVFQALGRAQHGAERTVPFVVSAANNHIMDFGRKAFDEETIPHISPAGSDEGVASTSGSSASSGSGAGSRSRFVAGLGEVVGVGRNLSEASSPATVDVRGTTVRVFAFSTACSGTPRDWAASGTRSGVVWLPPLVSSDAVESSFATISRAIESHGGPGGRTDAGLFVVSIHWGPNWAYRESADGQVHRQRLAHRLIDELGVDLIYGHSSHHVRGLEVYRDKLIMYGAGDLINDYEGFINPGDEAYSMLGCVFLVDLEQVSGRVLEIVAVPTTMDRLASRRVTRTTLFWDPRSERSLIRPHAVDDLAFKVNVLSVRDTGSQGRPVEFRVAEASESYGVAPAGPVLVWAQSD